MEGEELNKRAGVEKTTGIPQACEAAEQEFIARDLTDRERDAARSVLAGLTAEDAAPERRRRRARRIAVGVVAGIVVMAVCAALAWKFLPVDAFWEFVTGDVTGIENVNGVYYAVNKDGLTFGSIRRANLPIPWEDVTETSGWDSIIWDVWECCPDLIATRTTLESSTEEGEAGYLRRDDFISGKESAESWCIVWDIRGREIGVLKYGRFEAR